MEITKRLATDNINKFLTNTHQYLSNTIEEQEEKNTELPDLVVESLISSITEVRPYTNIVNGMRILNYNIDYKRLDSIRVEARVELAVRSSLNLETNSSTTLVELDLALEPKGEKLLIIEYNKTATNIDSESEFDEVMTEDIPMVITFTNYLLEEKPNLTYLYYAYRGRPSIDPFNYVQGTPTGVDMYTIIYWMMKNQDIPNDFNYPLIAEDFINYDGIYEVFKKGHKYKYYLDDLEKGDFIFFDDNDTIVAIYIGDNQAITITGQQPYDRNGGLSIIVLEDEWWERFNGRVMRFKEEDIVRWEIM